MTNILQYDPIAGVRTRKTITGPESIAQKVFIRLRTFRGSWDLDIGVGLPWEEWLETKTVSLVTIQEEIQREIGRTRGVLSVAAVSAESDPETQIISLAFQVQLEDDPEETRLLRLGMRDFELFRASLDSITVVNI